MKKRNYIFIIVAILGTVFAFFLFSKEGIAINVNSKNKDLVYQSLNGEIENTDNVTKQYSVVTLLYFITIFCNMRGLITFFNKKISLRCKYNSTNKI